MCRDYPRILLTASKVLGLGTCCAEDSVKVCVHLNTYILCFAKVNTAVFGWVPGWVSDADFMAHLIIPDMAEYELLSTDATFPLTKRTRHFFPLVLLPSPQPKFYFWAIAYYDLMPCPSKLDASLDMQCMGDEAVFIPKRKRTSISFFEPPKEKLAYRI